MKYKIYSDLDGVIADFDSQFKKYSKGLSPKEYIEKYNITKFWTLIHFGGEKFWEEIPLTEDGMDYWDYIKEYNPTILSAPSRAKSSRTGKQKWVNTHLPGVELLLEYSHNKKKYATPTSILIDDRKKNIREWVEEGGIGILHTCTSTTISKLKKYGI